MPNGTKVVEMKTRIGVAGEQTYREALKNISRELQRPNSYPNPRILLPVCFSGHQT